MFPTKKIEKLRFQERHLSYVTIKEEAGHPQQTGSVVKDGW